MQESLRQMNSWPESIRSYWRQSEPSENDSCDQIELIASENYTSPAVLAAQGSVLTNKYAEGYPGHRYYGGCEYVDVAEELARQRPRSCSGQNMPTCSPTRARRPMRPPIWLY